MAFFTYSDSLSQSFQMHPYILSSWFQNEAQSICRKMKNPTSSWEEQRKIHHLFRTNFAEKEIFQADYILCTQVGKISQEGDVQLPRLEFSTSQLRNIRHSHGDLSFASQKLIDELIQTSDQLELNEQTIRRLFSMLRESDIPWDINNDGCDVRAKLSYYLLLALGIPVHSIKKQYCISSKANVGKRLKQHWQYHVAISIEDAEGKKWIFDPSVFSEPKPVNEWLEFISPQNSAITNYTAGDLPLARPQDSHVFCLEVPGNECATIGSKIKKGDAQEYSTGILSSQKIDRVLRNHTFLNKAAGHALNWSLRMTRIKRFDDSSQLKLVQFLDNPSRNPIPLPEEIANIKLTHFIVEDKYYSKQIFAIYKNNSVALFFKDDDIKSIDMLIIEIKEKNENLKAQLRQLLNITQEKFALEEYKQMEAAVMKKEKELEQELEQIIDYLKQVQQEIANLT